MMGYIRGQGYLLTALQVMAWSIFLVLWGVVAMHDWHVQKISRKQILFGLRYGILCYLLVITMTILGHYEWVNLFYKVSFYQDVLLHMFAVTLASVGLWYLKVWPAGDAKLFFMLGLLYPIMKVQPSFHNGWLFLILLINIFIPAAVIVFFSAVRFIWISRLRHMRDFFVRLGPKLAVSYFRDRLKEGYRDLLIFIRDGLRSLITDPIPWLRSGLSWVALMGLMSILSYSIQEVISSVFLRTLFCFGLILLWGWVSEYLQKWDLLILAGLVGFLIVTRNVDGLWGELWHSFQVMALFGFFMYIGMQWGVSLLAGRFVLLVLPIFGLLLGVFPPVIQYIRTVFNTVLLPDMSWILSWGVPLSKWAALGLFFGVSYIFVKIWDKEDHRKVAPDELAPFLLLHPAFEDVLRQDEEFFSEFFDSIYADGLTEEQVDALKEWCPRNGIALVPLATTISFANWIFLGVFLTCLLNRQILQYPF